MRRHCRITSRTHPLNMAVPGETVELVEIRGGRRMRKRLADLGLCVGMLVRIIQGTSSGPMLLAFKEDARLAIGSGIAHKIIVSPYEPDSHH
ncbi:MAG: ferrous iron transport protein A [Anaerolineae bacterium]|nr:ferrous iron transport protein A [Anaerolineae bacterium]